MSLSAAFQPVIRLNPLSRLTGGAFFVIVSSENRADYAGVSASKPEWRQPETLVWNYEQFGQPAGEGSTANPLAVQEILLALDSKFE